jgi:hypothetical protein
MKDDAVEPLVIKFKPAGILLGNVSEILIHRYVQAGKLDAVRIGGLTMITMESIKRLVAEGRNRPPRSVTNLKHLTKRKRKIAP